MRIFKRLCLFLAANLLVAFFLNFLLTDPSIVGIYLRDIKENEYDTLIIGTSHGETGIDPFLLGELTNAEVFNASRRLMPVVDQYYLLKTANQDRKIKTVYYELDPSYWISTRDISTHDDTCMLRHASFADKADYTVHYLLSENYNYTLFPYTFDARAVKKIPSVVRSKLTLKSLPPDEQIRSIYRFLGISENFDYMGRGFRYGQSEDPLSEENYVFTWFSDDLISDHTLDAFRRMVRYCRDEDIRLVCMVSALPARRLYDENHHEAHAYFSALCKAEGVEFYDMNYLREDLLPRTQADYTDRDGHMMGELARRQTQLLAEILSAQDKDAYFTDNYHYMFSQL